MESQDATPKLSCVAVCDITDSPHPKPHSDENMEEDSVTLCKDGYLIKFQFYGHDKVSARFCSQHVDESALHNALEPRSWCETSLKFSAPHQRGSRERD
jgi:hypothetical protein